MTSSGYSRVEVWPSQPTANPGASRSPGSIDQEEVFASGRQALTSFLRTSGFGRESRVAIPRWSSACVISAVGEVATPVPIDVVVQANAEVDVVLLYEQWGWTLPADFVTEVCRQLGPKALILDRVDSAVIDATAIGAAGPLVRQSGEIWSLSKLLGFEGGGLLRSNGNWQKNEALVGTPIEWTQLQGVDNPLLDHLRKCYATDLPLDLGAFIDKSDVLSAIQRECDSRRQNVELLKSSGYGDGWPTWMHDGLMAGGAPGIAPLLRGRSGAELQQARAILDEAANIATEPYHFNFAGDVLSPRYEACLALPIHGGLSQEQLQFGLARLAESFPDLGKRSKSVIVGGGLAGVMAARVLIGSPSDVTVLEHGPEFGGLLRSVEAAPNYHFDFGTHFVLSTGHADIDRMMLSGSDIADYHVFDKSLAEGHYFNGVFNQETGCIDTRTLETAVWEKGCQELLAGASADIDAANFETYGRQVYGHTFFEKVFAPIVTRLTDTDPAELDSRILSVFSMSRLVAFDSEETRILKRAPDLDRKIAFNRFLDGTSNIMKYYPKTGGVGRWIEEQCAYLEKAGVSLQPSAKITALHKSENRIASVELEDGRRLDCDRLVWSAPLSQFLLLAGEKISSPPPKFRHLLLYHFVFDQALLTKLHWVCCYDPGFLTYRITCYPNITQEAIQPPPHHLTVEVIAGDAENAEAQVERVRQELVQIGIVPSTAALLHSKVNVAFNALPVPTVEFVANQAEQLRAAERVAENVVFAGRSGGAHFQADILRQVYESLN